MRVVVGAVVGGLLCGLVAATPARAQTGPVIVVPGKPGVPVIINGVDVSGAVVYGDWGLARPGQGQIMIAGPVAYAPPGWWGGYYPATGHRPYYGRYEIVPPANRPLPTPAADYRRTWGIESDTRAPVTEYPPFNPPPVIMAPQARKPRTQGP